ncbi:MAG: haloacid dehalogenase [Betaproteobacteria bacterium HGW-Betaproteobacteria-4]|nr:MAG: haloacid dehalogenase [Betaproteobacteria bacterium HGW-Betaproteobacteria-4]
MPPLHALIFDVDGTLADTERDGHRPAFNHAFADLGLDWHWDERLYGQLLAITGGKERIRHYAARHAPHARQRGLRLAIATTTTPENVTALLHATLGPDAPGWFEIIGAGDIVPNKKPAPDIYRWVLDRLALPAENCLAIEDSANGLRAARAAGLRCLVTPNDYTAGDDFSGAWQVLADLREIDLDTIAAPEISKLAEIPG